ncbi:histone-lysine N-methyltransferase ASHH2-like isoform X1, putative [Babesia ovata]|uniref:Histone-lysine N-methyltransferase ASHH2-like isoform X1, putative n=1 Tax=Babesia ovata TaxID=189622 RepID=A0A2H6KCP4_9APIC|nr:histone-lysine N-methyltransferase ASHH2-like isoform X1, putative [Babesia ovata]GBE60729.1 histone-lysine N-methyltransferase ASHH2-like isoform X1, putative [Babesia ovata]
MVASAVLPMLYEFLVSESRYEVRGSEYRSRLRSLFEEMLSAQLTFPPFPLIGWRQPCYKPLEDMVNSVGFADCEDVRVLKLAACPGIHQYAYPEIPDYVRLDAHYLKQWNYFFGVFEKRERVGAANRPRRIRAGESSGTSSSCTESEEDDSLSESEESVTLEHLDAVITTDDILLPRVRPDDINKFPTSDARVSGGEEGSADDATVRWGRHVPIYMDSSYKIDHGVIVFGVLNDAHLAYEWSCNGSYGAYESTLQKFADGDLDTSAENSAEEGPFIDELTDDSVNGDAAAPAEDMAMDVDATVKPKSTNKDIAACEANTDCVARNVPYEELNNVSTAVSGRALQPACSNNGDNVDEDMEDAAVDTFEDDRTVTYNGDDDEDASEGQSDDDSVVDGEEAGEDDSYLTAPYDPKSIYGNYYCALPNGYDSHQITLDGEDVGGTVERGPAEYKSYTQDAMEIMSTMIVGADGVPQLSCVGTLGERDGDSQDPRLRKYHKRQVTLQNRLEDAISSLFAIKNAVSAQCTTCSGWSLNNGIAVIFCEICEDRMLEEFDPSVINRLFELRRLLVSDLYPAIGYHFVDSDASMCAKGEGCATHVTIPALCEVGGTYPKASLRDGRCVPNTADIPRKALHELSSIVLTNAELSPYAESGSRILALCNERRRQRLHAFNYYLETLCRLYETTVSNQNYPLVVEEFNNVFKKGMLPFMSNPLENRSRFFDELTSSLFCKMPLDVDLLRKLFYRRGIYGDRGEGPRGTNLLALAEQDGHRLRNTSHTSMYNWHTVAFKFWSRKSSTVDRPCKTESLKSASSIARSTLYKEFVTRAGTFDRMPRDVSSHLQNNGKLDVGFPTSLEMHVAGVPDAVLDPLLYTKCGMAFYYSLPAIIQNMCALSQHIRVCEETDGRSKRKARENAAGKPV